MTLVENSRVNLNEVVEPEALIDSVWTIHLIPKWRQNKLFFCLHVD